MDPSTSQKPADIFAFVPSYNHAPFVERCLRSIINQTSPPKKLLVIDDGSRDGSAGVIEGVLKECPFDSELIVRENRGLCATLNEGLKRSSGEYFAYIGSDDIWLPRFLESRSAVIAGREKAVLAYGHSYLIDEQDRIFDHTELWGPYVDGPATEMLLTPRIPASASVLYRREALEKTGWHEGSILEDYDLYLRLSAIGEFALDPRTLSAWRIHTSNTSADFPLMMNEWLNAIRRNADVLGLTESDLTTIERRIKFTSVTDFLRHGRKREALGLFTGNIAGARSAAQIVKTGLRFFVPTAVFKRISSSLRESRRDRFKNLSKELFF